MSPVDNLAAELGDVRALVADVAVEAARIAAAIKTFSEVASSVELVRLVRRCGYAEGLAVHDDRQADARARQARAQFTVIRGGNSDAPAMPRKTPRGAA